MWALSIRAGRLNFEEKTYADFIFVNVPRRWPFATCLLMHRGADSAAEGRALHIASMEALTTLFEEAAYDEEEEVAGFIPVCGQPGTT